MFIAKVIMHRGVSSNAPENTLAALRLLVTHELPCLECDVQLTQDDVAVIFHDERLERTTTGRGCLSKKRYTDIEALDAGSWFHPDFGCEKVPLLEDYLEFIKQHDLAVNLEIKGRYHYKVLVEVIMLRLQQANITISEQVLLSSTSLATLKYIRKSYPEVNYAWIFHAWPWFFRKIVKDPHCIAVSVNEALLSDKRIRRLKNMGKKILAYTVNDNDRAVGLFTKGVDAVFTDDLTIGLAHK